MTAWPLRPDRPIGGDELARGLTLVQASALKMARLHVAMECRDRRLVLETMDDLVSLDGEIRDLVDRIPRSNSEIDTLQSELDVQRAALAREKLALVGGVSRGRVRCARAQPGAAMKASERTEPSRSDQTVIVEPGGLEAGQPASESWIPVSPEKDRRDWSTRVFPAAIVLFLFAALAGAAWLFAMAEPKGPIGNVPQALGGRDDG